ncbi:MAG: hypothetical protein A2452_12160 [Candidatus Firestonebacteria bacterium RIFOXYC2_FULL_39_67]|nr:MAG: hypothetical protein A2536_00175 [Candidatus Firestonebacteria bacterium RIFOXYD2_FULL_39_29]OGF55720.1 MAG: hypothetical protein A2452_12160 [Candidatus Firestonebacteria bacterium RIFOXYC2_FULL_39_67]OGF57963.1 MAG: hypothetical protein A2497_02375 [Candidatus Firestonebacteria bacterium RifOxyC12_full_39_7]
MKKIIIASLLLCITSSAVFPEVVKKTTKKNEKGFTREVTYYNGDQEIAKEIIDESWKSTVTGKIPDGIVKEYYESGELYIEWNYKNNKKDGLSKAYYKDGKVSGEWNYKNGESNGFSKSYYENGTLKYESSFSDGKRDGSDKEYYKNGQLKREANYAKNELDVVKAYFKDGKIRSISTYKNGNPFNDKIYDKNGELTMDSDSGYFPVKATEKEKAEGVNILKQWVKENTITINLPDWPTNGPGLKEITSDVTIADINKAIKDKAEEEEEGKEENTYLYDAKNERVELKTISLGKGTPCFAFLVQHGHVGWDGGLWKINENKSLEFVLGLGGWHSGVFFMDIDKDGVQEIINTELMLSAGGLNLRKYGIDLGHAGMTKVYKWKNNKFEIIGRMFDNIDPK